MCCHHLTIIHPNSCAVSNTVPNSALRLEDGSYAPAHMLPDARLERAGRQSKVQRQVSEAGSANRTAALLIIGDEILSAKVEDANTPFLCRELRAIGWTVNKVVVVRDDVLAICQEVRRLSAAHDIVITAGGLGGYITATRKHWPLSLQVRPRPTASLLVCFPSQITRAWVRL